MLEATALLIAEQGARAEFVAAVGEAAGYSRGIVNHHFGSRRAVMETLARTLQAKVAPVSAELRGLDRVIAQVDAWFAILRAQPRDFRAFLILWAEAIAADPDLHAIFAERDHYFRSVLVDALNQGLSDGTVRADTDPTLAALAIVGQLRGIGLQLMLSRGDTDLDSLRHEVLTSLRHCFGEPPNSRSRTGTGG